MPRGSVTEFASLKTEFLRDFSPPANPPTGGAVEPNPRSVSGLSTLHDRPDNGWMLTMVACRDTSPGSSLMQELAAEPPFDYCQGMGTASKR